MDTQKQTRLEITDRQGNRIVSENAAGQTIATLQGTALSANRGTSLNLDWVESVRVNLSAVERRAATIVTRRTVKKDWQIAWLLRAISCMDLTTLSGDDTEERVRRLCAKARLSSTGLPISFGQCIVSVERARPGFSRTAGRKAKGVNRETAAVCPSNPRN